MKIPLFIIAAVVLVVFALAASASASLTFLGVTWVTWLCSSLLAFFANLLIGSLDVS